jgi:uncharacterized protein YsxB (DUF464 family)
MVEVRFRRDSRNRLSSVVSRGHAGQAEPGEDVACAAVSALLQAAWAGLTDVAGVEVTGRHRKGNFLMQWPEDARDRPDVHAIIATAEIAIEQIGKQNRRFVRYLRESEPEQVTRRENPGRAASKGTAR